MYKYRQQYKNINYYKYPEKPYPKTIFWNIVAGPPNFELSPILDHDVIFDDYDYRIRNMDPKTGRFVEFNNP